MDARQWQYVGEGGQHALFASKHLPEKLLRLDKLDLARACTESNASTSEEVHSEVTLPIREKFLVRFLDPYADSPEMIKLSWSFVCDLRNESIRGGRIPESRLCDWIAEPDTVSGLPLCLGQILPDYRISRSPTVSCYEAFCVEMKPKAGYRNVSPFVHPRRRAKYQYSRFVLSQQLYRNQKVRKSWMSDTEPDCSHYDPFDLFSGDKLRMEQAVQAMIATPQNNFQLWCKTPNMPREWDGKPPIDTSSLSELFMVDSNQNMSHEIAQRQLVNVLVEVLSEESFLQQTLLLQQLDVIDGDGAILLFDHLVKLVGDEVCACSLIDAYDLDSASETCRHPLMVHTPFATPKNHENLFRLLDEIVRFKNRLSHQEIPDVRCLDAARGRTIENSKFLSIEECCYLLRNWLLSLTMCDISFFVSFRRAPNAQKCTHTDGSQGNDFNGWSVIKRQKENPGVVSYKGYSNMFLEYEIKAIDFDLKPAEKLRTRRCKEELLNDLQVDSKSKET